MRSALRDIETACWVVGAGLIVAFVGARTASWHQQRVGLRQFSELVTQANAARVSPEPQGFVVPEPNRVLWSAERRRDYEQAANARLDPIGLLRIPNIGLAAPIYEGTSSAALNRGAGRIESTALLDVAGNVGLAAHRDGFFRGLKDVRIDDPLTIETLQGTRTYRVVDLIVTSPADVGVLAPTGAPSVTLVTCYPFYFVGAAPERYVVRAEGIAP